MSSEEVKPKKYLSRVKFYADTPMGEKNKYFCWDIDSILSAEETVLRFMAKKWVIRAVWFENINTETGEITDNLRFNMSDLLDKLSKLKT